MRVFLTSLVCVLALALSGCGISLTPAGESPDLPPLNPQEIPTHMAPATSLPDSPTQGDATQMNPSLSTPSLPTLQKLIEKAKEDLVKRFSIPSDQINFKEATEVVWPDSSLGCPNPSSMYTQILTPGYMIQLEALARVFEYHTNRGGLIIYCENPSLSLPGGLPDK